MRLCVLYGNGLHTCTEETLRKQYITIIGLVRQINRALPQLHQRKKYLEPPPLQELHEAPKVRQAAHKVWLQICQLYTVMHNLAELLSGTHYQVWHFMGDPIRDHGTVVTMPGEIEMQVGIKLEELFRGTEEIFVTCGYLLELCGLDMVWEHGKSVALCKIAYPSYTEADRPLRLKWTRREIVADIRENCHEQITLAREIFQIAAEYLEDDSFG